MNCSVLQDEELIGRRRSVRHSIDISGRLISPRENLRLQLEDISATGACFRLMHPRILREGHLCWLGKRAYGRIVWQSGLRCGFEFDEPLADDLLQHSLWFGEMASSEAREKYARLASAWVFGPGDW